MRLSRSWEEARDRDCRWKSASTHANCQITIGAYARLYCAEDADSTRPRCARDRGGRLSGRAYNLSAESMWIKFASLALTMILFLWSVVASVVFKGRDFG